MAIEDTYYDDWFGPRFIIGGGGGGGSWGGGGIDVGFPDIDLHLPDGGGSGGGGAPSVSQSLTAVVNSYEYQLKANLALWNSNGISAADAVAKAWNLMNSMVSACLPYGVEGSKAAAERDRRINPSMLRWDWIAYYIDPITGGNTALPPVPGGGVNTNLGLSPAGGGIWVIVGLLALLYLSQE